MREVLNILYCHGLGSSINNRVGTGLVEYFRNTPYYFERLLYRNPGSRHIPWNISEWREDIEKRVDGKEWVVIASSAGCHAALNAAKNRPSNIKGLFLFCPGVSLTFDYVNTITPGGSAALQNGRTLIHPASRGGHEALINRECLQHYLDWQIA
ncbi:hypothetical protein OESDEN_04236 [Oesophagostomum dentatum]|uniref:Serine hydrolase FSH domain-containing protein n=1 Tax=Oesophagostomum dentatum TaxID=61180 RepID=A0A0B1TE33_OESDE|nr:hypothetical protein OESDEN_04236 [Oesophagostomum dentatum]